MLKSLVCLVTIMALSSDAMACGGLFARGAVRHTLRVHERVRFAFVRPTLVVPAPALAPVPTPMPPKIEVMPSAKPASSDLELRVQRMEKAMTDAGRSLLFRNDTAQPGVKFSAPPVAYAGNTGVSKTRTITRTGTTPVRTFLFFGARGCPTGGCP